MHRDKSDDDNDDHGKQPHENGHDSHREQLEKADPLLGDDLLHGLSLTLQRVDLLVLHFADVVDHFLIVDEAVLDVDCVLLEFLHQVDHLILDFFFLFFLLVLDFFHLPFYHFEFALMLQELPAPLLQVLDDGLKQVSRVFYLFDRSVYNEPVDFLVQFQLYFLEPGQVLGGGLTISIAVHVLVPGVLAQLQTGYYANVAPMIKA